MEIDNICDESQFVYTDVIYVGKLIYKCKKLIGYKGNNTKITIGDNADNIPVIVGKQSFEGNEKIISVTISKNVIKIEDEAFKNCLNLKEVIICENDNLEPFNHNVFTNCKLLKSILINNQNVILNDISNYFLFNGKDIKSVNNLNKIYKDFDFVVKKIETDSGMVKCLKLSRYKGYSTKITIGDSNNDFPIIIGDRCFEKNEKITNITILGNVIGIESDAFKDCASLTSIIIPNSVVSIRESAFQNCTNLVIFSEFSSKPKGWRFNLDNFNIKVVFSSYKGISGFTKDGFKFVALTDDADNPYISIVGYDGNENAISIPSVITYNKEKIKTKTIGTNAFKNSSLTNVIIPSTIISIGESAFSNCSSLTSVDIPDSVVSIKKQAFFSCENLLSVKLNNTSNLTSIGEEAFDLCTRLKAIYIPGKVSQIDSTSFDYTTTTLYCYITANVDDYQDECNQFIVYNRPIYSYQLEGYEDFELVKYVKFYDQRVSSTGIVYNVCTDRFNNKYVIIIDYIGTSDTVLLPESFEINGETFFVQEIGNFAFYNNSIIRKVFIPRTIKKIGLGSFLCCTNLTIYVDNQFDGKLFNYSFWTENDLPVLKKYTPVLIFDSYLGISGCINDFVYAVCIDDNGKKFLTIVKYLGTEKNISIPTHLSIEGDEIAVERVASFAFYCSQIKKVYIPKSIICVCNFAFASKNLTIFCEAESEPEDWDTWWNESKYFNEEINVEKNEIIWNSKGIV